MLVKGDPADSYARNPKKRYFYVNAYKMLPVCKKYVILLNKDRELSTSLVQCEIKCPSCNTETPLHINSLRPSDSYMRQYTNHHCFR